MRAHTELQWVLEGPGGVPVWLIASTSYIIDRLDHVGPAQPQPPAPPDPPPANQGEQRVTFYFLTPKRLNLKKLFLQKKGGLAMLYHVVFGKI